jgi:DNA-binding NtrC family response regulator
MRMSFMRNRTDIRKNILLVEDDRAIRELCHSVLSRNGFECISAADGVTGFETYKVRKDDLSLILSDLSMPAMGGIGMIHEILNIDPGANVILMSGYNPDEVVPCDIRKFCSVLRKPFTPAQLLQAVERCLECDAEVSTTA